MAWVGLGHAYLPRQRLWHTLGQAQTRTHWSSSPAAGKAAEGAGEDLSGLGGRSGGSDELDTLSSDQSARQQP